MSCYDNTLKIEQENNNRDNDQSEFDSTDHRQSNVLLLEKSSVYEKRSRCNCHICDKKFAQCGCLNATSSVPNNPIIEFCSLRSKMYSILTGDGEQKSRTVKRELEQHYSPNMIE